MTHKSGFVNVLGRPNVGKSTLINLLMGEKLSIVTPKPQTTRHRILALLNGADYQVVFSDTPGIILDPNYELQRSMNKFAYSGLEDADILIIMTDVFTEELFPDSLMETIGRLEIPKFLVINKTDIDTKNQADGIHKKWTGAVRFSEVFFISALTNSGTEGLLPAILKHLPECPPYYPDDQLSDKTERFFVSEIIREQVLIQYQQEIPYSVEVEVIEFKESIKKGEDFVHIFANLYVARKSQKAILIGHQGQSIKQLGTESRKAIESFLGKKVHLELYVKVLSDWRNAPQHLRNFGYN